MSSVELVNAKDTFVSAVEKCLELPQAVREAARQSAVEEHSVDQFEIALLDNRIRLSPFGPEWTERLKRRREAWLRFTGRPLLRSRLGVGSDDYYIEVDPNAEAVVYWERYEEVRSREDRTPVTRRASSRRLEKIEPHLDMHVLCKKCDYTEVIAYSALIAKKTHNCAQCGEAIDLSPYLRAADELMKRYALGGGKKVAE